MKQKGTLILFLYCKDSTHIHKKSNHIKEVATHLNVLALEILWTEETAGYSPRGCKRVGHGLATKQQSSF